MYIRQALILDILSRTRKRLSKYKLIQLLFLISRETDINKHIAFYDFINFKQEPFSFTANKEISDLIADGFIEGNPLTLNQNIRRPEDAQQPKSRRVLYNHISYTYSKYAELSNEELKNIIHKKYPKFSLSDHRQSQSATKSCENIYTIGYEGVSLDVFFSQLIETNICNLIDVRNNPRSRKFGFNGNLLSDCCDLLGIRYHSFPQVGIPSKFRRDLKNKNDYARLFKRYREEILASKKTSIDNICRIAQNDKSALLCFEANPDFCHRLQLANKIFQQTGLGLCNL